MPNAFASALVVDSVSTEAITVLQNRLAPLGAFASDFSADIVDPLRDLQVSVVASTGAVTTNPSTFGSTRDTTVNATKVTMVHFHKGFGLSHAEINEGHRLERIIRINLHALADALIDAAMVPVTTVNFGAAVVTTSANFISAGGGSQTLWAALKNGTRRVLVVDGALYATMLPTTKESIMVGEAGAFGWDGGIYYNNRWTGAVANCKGFAASPEALAFAARIPAMHPAVAQQLFEQSNITIPGLGLTVQFNLWGSLSSRALEASFDVCFGAEKADTSALKLITYA